MKIGVISDIHDRIDNLLKSFIILQKAGVEKVIFCGDLNSPFTIDYFRRLNLPILAVFGNCEGDKIRIKERIEKNTLDFRYAPKQGLMWDLKLDSKRVGVYHGFQKEILENVLDSGHFNIFLSGHTHISKIMTIKNTLWINPGCVCGWAGLDIDPVKASLAILDTTNSLAKIIIL